MVLVEGRSPKKLSLKASDLVLKSLGISAYVQRLNGINWIEIPRSAT